MRLVLTVFLAALVAACSFKPAKIFATYTQLEVREVGRSLYCNTEAADTAAYLFADAAAVQAWQASRGLNLVAAGALADAPHALVEMGQRPTGGYGLAVSRAAVLRGELLILSATFISPGPDRMVSQALTSPCVLVRLPPGRYSTVEVQDQAGAARATGKAMPAGSDNVTP
jgi:hypothetical protein